MKKRICTIALFLLASCSSPIHHEIKEDIVLKDSVTIHINTDFTVESQEALKEIKLKSDKLKFALRIALRDHASTELKGRGKLSVLNAWKSISKQFLDHPVKHIDITSYEFNSKTHASRSKKH